jgi:nitroreductase
MTRERTLEIGRVIADAFRNVTKAGPQSALDPSMAEYITSNWDKGNDVIFRGAPQLAVTFVDKSSVFPEDAAIALTYFELAAHANGVGCCWGGIATMAARASEAVRDAMKAREDELVVGAQMFGYPDIDCSRILPPRKATDVSWLPEGGQ